MRFGFYLYFARSIKETCLTILQIKTSTTYFNNPVNRNLLGSDKSRLTSKVDCLPSDALSNGKTYRHTSGFFSPRVWIIMRYFYASSFAPFHWIFWASRTRSQERVPLKTERLFFSVPFAFPLRSLSVP